MGFQYLKNDMGHFVCPNCGIIKERQNTMHYHMKRCTGNGHKCAHCNSEFIQQHSLDIHIQTEHPDKVERPVQEHYCPFDGCRYKCLSKGNTRVHYLRNHCKDLVQTLLNDVNNDKILKCNSCNETFGSQPAFIYHTPYCMKMIAGDSRFEHLYTLCM
jgi:hypothetical protein